VNEKNKNLLVRIATALVLLPIVVTLVWVGGLPFTLLIAVAAGICGGEVAAMALGDSPRLARILVVVAAAAVPLLFGLAPVGGPGGDEVLVFFGALVVILWIVHLFSPGDDLSRVPGQVGISVMAILYTGGLLTPVALLRGYDASGFWWILLVMAVTWINDTGGYTAGRLFGRHKLYPKVSPAKTWEGFAGGLVGSVGGAVLVVALSRFLAWEAAPPLPIGYGAAVVLGLFTGAVAPAGDLCESLLKRAYGAKDSGRILPGHGGLLDRIDALLFTGIVVWIFALILSG
jgi:phosphatidate cytidylyltransferase